jgi:predicted secreted protein
MALATADASTWAARLHDQRSGRVVFLSHCLLNENTRYLGGAGRQGGVAEIVKPCLEQGIGIVQLPCPEERAWGGVLKRRLLGFYGADARMSFRFRAVLLPIMLFYTRRVYRRLARHVANQVHDYVASGYTVLGIVGVDGSPSCGVRTTMNMARAFVEVGRLSQGATATDVNAIVRRNAVGGNGLFAALLREELVGRGLNIPFAAHDLLAEVEGRKVVSAFDTLRSSGAHPPGADGGTYEVQPSMVASDRPRRPRDAPGHPVGAVRPRPQ